MKKQIVVTLVAALLSVNAFCLPAFSLEGMEEAGKKIGAELEKLKQKQATTDPHFNEVFEQHKGILVEGCGLKDFYNGRKELVYENIKFTSVYNKAAGNYNIVWTTPKTDAYDQVIVAKDMDAHNYHSVNLNARMDFKKNGKTVKTSIVTLIMIDDEEYHKYPAYGYQEPVYSAVANEAPKYQVCDICGGDGYHCDCNPEYISGKLAKDAGLNSVPKIYKNDEVVIHFEKNDKGDISYNLLKKPSFNKAEVSLAVEKTQDPHFIKVLANVKIYNGSKTVQSESIVIGNISDQEFFEKAAYKSFQSKDNYTFTPAEPCGKCASCKAGDTMHCTGAK